MEMREQTLAPTAEQTAGGPDGVFGTDNVFTPTATVTHGVHRERVPLRSGDSVGEIRRRLRDRLAIDRGSAAFVDGSQADDATTVHAGQTVTFMRQAGEKGARR
jgi:hypothetical protein